mmetsp:Transcript_3703/g.5545  ORF Transcript_3703/g.5545 Transcript_3703/m.5545 type:complete len:148 (+) Transcript_3703:98-541(+)
MRVSSIICLSIAVLAVTFLPSSAYKNEGTSLQREVVPQEERHLHTMHMHKKSSKDHKSMKKSGKKSKKSSNDMKKSKKAEPCDCMDWSFRTCEKWNSDNILLTLEEEKCAEVCCVEVQVDNTKPLEVTREEVFDQNVVARVEEEETD